MKSDPKGDGGQSGRRLPVIFEPLRHRDFRLLWSGMTVSLLGDGIFIVALAWQVYELSDAATALSLVGLAMTIPNVLFLLIGGVVSDRFDRRRVLLAADLVRGLAVAAMGVLSLNGTIELWHLMGLAALYGGGTAFFGPAFDAIVPDLVASDLLIQANSLDQFVRPAAWRLAGPAMGGFLVAWSTGGAFLIDAVTFGISIVALLLMSPHPIDAPMDAGPATAMADIREGFRFVRARVWLWGTLLAASFAYLLFIGPQEVLLPLLVKDHWGGDPKSLGFILAMGGVGAIGAALYMGQRAVPVGSSRSCTSPGPSRPWRSRATGWRTSPGRRWSPASCSTRSRPRGRSCGRPPSSGSCPRHLLGRVSSLDWFISIGLLPLSFALTGPAANLFGTRATFDRSRRPRRDRDVVVPVPSRHALHRAGPAPGTRSGTRGGRADGLPHLTDHLA